MLTHDVIIVTIAALIVLLLLYLSMYFTERKSYILQWTLGWTLLLAAYFAQYSLREWGDSVSLDMINYYTTIWGVWFLFLGTVRFLKTSLSMRWFLSYLVMSFWALAGFIYEVPLALYALPSVILTSVTLFDMGLLLLFRSSVKGFIKVFVGVSSLLWGLITMFYPLFRMSNALPENIYYLVAGAFGLAISMGLVAVYFQRVKEGLSAKETKIEYMRAHDKLTGLYNRAFIDEILEAVDTPEYLPISIILGDMNGLKLINDTFGHAKGDELLVEMAEVLKSSCRAYDYIGRMGGDEFIIILPQTEYDLAEQMISRINANCRQAAPNIIPLSISLGASTKSSAASDLGETIREAEDRMYKNKLLESREMRDMIISFLEEILWQKDYQTDEHIQRLKDLVALLAPHISLSKSETADLALVAALHDIGKIAIPEHILKKEGPLTKQEWEVMRNHAEIGYRIAQSSSKLAHISEAILCHHEWWNGKGYPQGLKEEEIPLYSRIVAVADSYDVMTHDRPYKTAVSPEEALKEIRRCAGTQFDPHIAEVFCETMHVYMELESAVIAGIQ